MSVIVVCN